jgi:hypothetical protein
LNQEDAKPSNFVCMPYSKIPGNYIPVSVDNDRSFYQAFQVDVENGILTPQVKDITFCFDEMNLSISPLAREYFLALDPHDFLSKWLHALNLETWDWKQSYFSLTLRNRNIFQNLNQDFSVLFHF